MESCRRLHHFRPTGDSGPFRAAGSSSSFSAAILLLLIFAFFAPCTGFGSDTLSWNTNTSRVSADIQSAPLIRLLEGVSHLTGWKVYLESNATRTVSVKFNDLPSGEALRVLLGNLNFALVPQTNDSPRLYVFHTLQENATMLVRPGSLSGPGGPGPNVIPNQLLVTLKPGVNINGLDCLQDATVQGRLGNLNTYRIVFKSEEATRLARECLANNPDVESIESNLAIARPDSGQLLDRNLAPDFNLDLKSSDGDCKIIVGLIDTGFRSVGAGYDKFLMPGISVFDNHVPGNDLGHGQAMAGTILQAIQSTTKGSSSAKILPVDVYGPYTTTSTFDVAQGIYKAINSGANVINLSLGSPGDSQVLHNLITRASEQGIVFFGAAGNEPVTTPTFPAAYPEVIAVTAGDRNGQIASYANRGSFIDIMTPGTSVIPFNGQSYVISGTSAATAYASGIAAGLADSTGNCPPSVIPSMKDKLGVTPPQE